MSYDVVWKGIRGLGRIFGYYVGCKEDRSYGDGGVCLGMLRLAFIYSE